MVMRKNSIFMHSEVPVTVTCPCCGTDWELTLQEYEAGAFTCKECQTKFGIPLEAVALTPTDTNPTLSPNWIILYLVLASLCVQLLPNRDYTYLELRFAFFLVIGTVLFTHGQLRELPRLFMGRWLPRSVIWPLTFILLTAGTHLIFDAYFRLPGYPLNWNSVREGIIIAPLNEEPFFRGLFVNILFCSMPRHRWAAIVLSALIFASVHYSILWIAMLALTLQGLLYGACFAVTESVSVCILCHALWNAFNA